ncbi:hypothetical protein J2X55_002759 [Microbacterium sp. 1154]|nr:hypothetical protein [Microbacterium sp. 1154]
MISADGRKATPTGTTPLHGVREVAVDVDERDA